MDNLVIQKLNDQTKIPWVLLLLADPSREMIEQYIHDSDIYCARINNEIVGIYVLTKPSQDINELKNIAVDPQYQGKGIGKKLIQDAINNTKAMDVKRIEVGTGNSSLSQLAFYKKCGFKIVGVEKDFFTKNYPEKIIENGIICTDMIRLAIKL